MQQKFHQMKKNYFNIPYLNLLPVDKESRTLAFAPRSIGSYLTPDTNKAATDAIKLTMVGSIPEVPLNEHFYLLLRLEKLHRSINATLSLCKKHTPRLSFNRIT